jgi:acetoacetate decarboxylase
LLFLMDIEGYMVYPSFMETRAGWSRLRAMLTPEWLYDDAHYLVADMEVDARAVARFVPGPLKLASPPLASIFTAWFPNNSFGSNYREAGVFLHVVHRRKRAVYCPWMIVDDDVALIVGRELLGYPKKLGQIAFDLDGDKIRGVAERRGAELLRMEGTLRERVSDPPPMLGRPHRNVRARVGQVLPTILAFTPREAPIEVRRAELAVSVGSSERDPLAEMGFGRVRAAYLHRVKLGASGIPLPCALVSPLWAMRTLLLRTW